MSVTYLTRPGSFVTRCIFCTSGVSIRLISVHVSGPYLGRISATQHAQHVLPHAVIFEMFDFLLCSLASCKKIIQTGGL